MASTINASTTGLGGIQAFETNKASALAKLSALGLTADEIKVLLTP